MTQNTWYVRDEIRVGGGGGMRLRRIDLVHPSLVIFDNATGTARSNEILIVCKMLTLRVFLLYPAQTFLVR